MKKARTAWSEADCLEPFIYKSSIRVEYKRSLEYCLTWKRPMFPRHLSRTPRSSFKIFELSPRPNEEVIQPQSNGTRPRKMGPKKSKASSRAEAKMDEKIFEQSPRPNEEVIQPQSNGTRPRKMGPKKSKASSRAEAKMDEKRDRDILDIISNTREAERFFKKDDRHFVEVTDQGVDESDEDCLSVSSSSSSSIASGPSKLFQDSPKKGRMPQSLCSACHKLHTKAKRMKAPMKDKLLDNNPRSLTCDQWVLIKSWRPQRQLNPRGNLLTYITLIKRRLSLQSQAQHMEQCVRAEGQSACLKPHIFLQRNLRQCVRAPGENVSKKNRKKRKKEAPRGSRVAKKQRLNDRKQDELVNHVQLDVNGHIPTSSSAFEESCDQEVTVDLFPCSVAQETTRHVPAKSSKANTSRFGLLLAQLRGNSSMVVRETR